MNDSKTVSAISCCGSSCACSTMSAPVGATRQKRNCGARTFSIPTMDCPVEENDIRRALADIQGIRALRFELARRTLSIEADEPVLAAALEAIRAAGFEPQAIANDDASTAVARAPFDELWRAGLGLVFAAVAEVIHLAAPETRPFALLGMAVAAVAILVCGLPTYRKGLLALLRGQLNMNALMSVAATGAFLIGQWPEAAMVMALFAIAELVEARAADRARHAIQGLLALTPETAEVRRDDGGWDEQPADQVALGAIVRVRPGARIPLDGMVTGGVSAVNQAPVTGEAIPVDKRTGDPIFAGTINETAMLEFRVTAAAANTTLAHIIEAVEQAQSARAPMQRFIDRFAAVYTPAVFAFALAVALLSPTLLGWTWTQAIYKALVLLVIACPCALVIATPVTVVSGLAAAARRGILIKGGAYLEKARHLRAIALDKTGTITEGKPVLVAREVLAAPQTEAEILAWAARLANHSDHPVAQAIARGLALPAGQVGELTALPGRGVEGELDGHRLMLGNHRLIEERCLCSPELERRLAAHESEGRTVTLLASAEQVLAIFAVADTIKASSCEAVAELHRLGVASVMLTGDNTATAASIARQAGIDDARGNLLPEEKLAAVQELQERFGATAMTGDGINDAPALARADIGVAMGAMGTDIAMEAADIVIMNDDLRRIPEAIRLSRHTYAVLWQNIGVALGVKLVFFVLALLGGATMWMAVFADMGTSLLVVFNGLRLLRWRGHGEDRH